ncbi:MAG: sigma-70 family RNA polymerase sigma factor [Tannerellaceae bacterium]|jgi:RNA polymerase sigma-70 factor (ECF subfamily)|nr:sigma-70 family RNA polymerase sigma factor [Tannerellaceae bacterium]
MEEERLILGCARGEAGACEEVYKRFAPTMLALCRRYAGDIETARDLMQDGFVKVFLSARAYSGAGAFGGWVRKVFVTTCLEYLRRKDVLRYAVEVEGDGLDVEDVEAGVVDRLSAEDIMACIAALPTGYRTVFNLFAIEGYSHAEIGALLKISEITSRTQFIRARNSLRKSVRLLIDNGHESKQRAGRTP